MAAARAADVSMGSEAEGYSIENLTHTPKRPALIW
jgi:hypothetical protein